MAKNSRSRAGQAIRFIAMRASCSMRTPWRSCARRREHCTVMPLGEGCRCASGLTPAVSRLECSGDTMIEQHARGGQLRALGLPPVTSFRRDAALSNVWFFVRRLACGRIPYALRCSTAPGQRLGLRDSFQTMSQPGLRRLSEIREGSDYRPHRAIAVVGTGAPRTITSSTRGSTLALMRAGLVKGASRWRGTWECFASASVHFEWPREPCILRRCCRLRLTATSVPHRSRSRTTASGCTIPGRELLLHGHPGTLPHGRTPARRPCPSRRRPAVICEEHLPAPYGSPAGRVLVGAGGRGVAT